MWLFNSPIFTIHLGVKTDWQIFSSGISSAPADVRKIVLFIGIVIATIERHFF